MSMKLRHIAVEYLFHIFKYALLIYVYNRVINYIQILFTNKKHSHDKSTNNREGSTNRLSIHHNSP